MPFDDVVEVQAMVEELVPSQFKRVKGESMNETFSFGRNLKSDHGTLCQRLRVDGEGEGNDRQRQHG